MVADALSHIVEEKQQIEGWLATISFPTPTWIE